MRLTARSRFPMVMLSSALVAGVALADHPKHHAEAAIKHAPHPQKHEEPAKKPEHEHKAAEHAHKAAEHEKKAKAESEARIAAARKHRQAHPIQKAKQTAHDKQIAATLSKIAVSLHQADHDYDWQRHEAVELVRGALHDLHETEPNTEGAYGNMTQTRSDEILRQNIPLLERAKTELSAKGAPGHHQAARQKIEEAISNMHAALKIR